MKKRELRWTAALFICAAGGVFSGLGGLVLSTIGLSDNLRDAGRLGNWLIAGFFPLMLLAAHALDKAQNAKKTLRLAKCKRQGLKNEDDGLNFSQRSASTAPARQQTSQV